MSYDTGNAVPSLSLKDLADNAEDFDQAMNGTAPAFNDRFGRRRETWAGMERMFQDFLASTQFEPVHLQYVDGSALTVLRPTQIIDRNGVSYRVRLPAGFPVTLTGNWANDSANLTEFGDAAVRQDLANNSDLSKGANLIAGVSRIVPNVAGLRTTPYGISQSASTRGYLIPGDGGHADYDADLTDTTTADNGCTCIVGPDGVRWKLRTSGTLKLEQAGAVGAGPHDDAIDRAFTWAQADRGITEFSNGRVTFDSGKVLRVARQHAVTVPFTFECMSVVYTSHASGFAFVIGETFLARNTKWDFRFPLGARCTNGWTSSPTSVVADGIGFLEVRRAQFSRFEVGECLAFTRGAVYLNGSEDKFTNQHVQGNDFYFGEFGYNGFGLKMLSSSAETGGVQGNTFYIRNIFANFMNYQIDDDTHSNSTSNTFNIAAADMYAQGGAGFVIFSSYNTFNIGFAETSILVQASAYYNIFNIGNSRSSGVAISDVNGSNTWNCAVDLSQLPSVQRLDIDTEYSNQFGATVVAYFNVNLTPTASAASGLSVKVGRNSASLLEVLHPEAGATSNPSAQTQTVSVIIPHGHILKVSRTGSGLMSLSNVTYMQASR